MEDSDMDSHSNWDSHSNSDSEDNLKVGLIRLLYSHSPVDVISGRNIDRSKYVKNKVV